MYERSAIVLEKNFNTILGFDQKTNLKTIYKDFKELTEEIEDYQQILEEEDKIINEFDKVANEIRKIQQDAVLQESIKSNLTREKGIKDAEDFLETKEGAKQFSRFAFAQDKYSNGETTLQILEENIEPDKLYLLDEPEVSLSPKNQVELAKKINEMSRYLGIQFIISTHSPFMLGILDAKIYNLDTTDYRVQKWSELENVRYFYDFFMSRKDEFDK